MIIDNITDVHIRKNFSPSMHLKFMKTWKELSNGKHTTYDLGALTDKRAAKVSVLGLHSETRSLESYLETNKLQNTFNLQCESGEKIFGPEIEYNGVTFICHIVVIGFRQINFTDSVLDLRITLDDAQAVTLITPSMTPSLDHILFGYQYNRKNDDHTDLQLNYVDGGQVVGKNHTNKFFETTVKLLDDEWAAVKQYILSSRANTMSLPDMAMDPFGSDETGPYNVKLLKWTEQKDGLTFWSVGLKFSLEV